MATNTSKWFTSWFNTPYYHILYKDRDHSEAQLFMDKLMAFLDLKNKSKILDLACGKGRHSIYLNSLGYTVTGIDLSENSIAHAKQFENKTLQFKVHNMTVPYPDTFDAILNLFTSFGYFTDDRDNLKTIKAIKASLNTNGFGVIDFMNVNYVIRNLVKDDKKLVDGIEFKQMRKVENGYIKKSISFMDNDEDYTFEEQVRAFTLTDFNILFKQSGAQLIQVFGDYKLSPFNEDTSERLILIFK